MPPLAENVAYWSDNLSPEAAAALPPHAMGWGWPVGQASETGDVVQNADGSASATLTVPNNVSPSLVRREIEKVRVTEERQVAGAIIGKGGSRIRLVRKDSGAEISIENGSGAGSDRKVVVKGNPHQVRLAYSLLQQR